MSLQHTVVLSKVTLMGIRTPETLFHSRFCSPIDYISNAFKLCVKFIKHILLQFGFSANLWVKNILLKETISSPTLLFWKRCVTNKPTDRHQITLEEGFAC